MWPERGHQATKAPGPFVSFMSHLQGASIPRASATMPPNPTPVTQSLKEGPWGQPGACREGSVGQWFHLGPTGLGRPRSPAGTVTAMTLRALVQPLRPETAGPPCPGLPGSQAQTPWRNHRSGQAHGFPPGHVLSQNPSLPGRFPAAPAQGSLRPGPGVGCPLAAAPSTAGQRDTRTAPSKGREAGAG